MFKRGNGGVAEATDPAELRYEIDSLSRENREQPDLAREREILRLRQLAGTALVQQADDRKDLIEPDYDAVKTDTDVPEIRGDEVTPGLIRAAILQHGSILVRGLVDPEDATRLADGIDRAFADRDSYENGGAQGDGYYEELPLQPPNEPIPYRGAVKDGGGVLAPDSPRVAYEMFEVFEKANLRGIIGDYLGEAPAISANKTTLRKADPSIPGAWHQDGKFMGDVNSVNLWLSLSHCGDTAPGLDLVPRRIDHIVEAGVGDVGFNTIVVQHERAVELAGERGIVRPIFEPGDAMFFDHLFLHQTASDPQMPNPRFAIESWFFGPSAFPGDYIPLAV